MLTEDRLKEIRERAEREDYHCREHFASFDADQDVLDLLADRATLTAEHERLTRENAQLRLQRDQALAAGQWGIDELLRDKAVLEAERDALAARLSALEQAHQTAPDNVLDMYVPGAWKCPLCRFQLTQATLFVQTGEVGVSRDQVMRMTGEHCPNDGVEMARVTWRERAEENQAWGLSLMEDVIGAVYAEHLPGAIDAIRRHYRALTSISLSACCDRCNEARMVALAALTPPKTGDKEMTLDK